MRPRLPQALALLGAQGVFKGGAGVVLADLAQEADLLLDGDFRAVELDEQRRLDGQRQSLLFVGHPHGLRIQDLDRRGGQAKADRLIDRVGGPVQLIE